MLLAVVIAGCTISPRRLVDNNPSPSPTPTVSPTPTPAITPTPFPTPTASPTPTPTATPLPTPTPMAAEVAATKPEFLYTADPSSGLLSGYRISADGSLTPVPGSPFVADHPPQKLAALRNVLLMAAKTTITAYEVDQESGSIRRTDSLPLKDIAALTVDVSSGAFYASTGKGILAYKVTGGRLHPAPAPTAFPQAPPDTRAGDSALDRTGKFMYVLDHAAAVVSAFRVKNLGLVPLSPASYPTSRGTLSLAIAAP